MKRSIALMLLVLLVLNLGTFACAQEEVCIGPDGGIAFGHSYWLGTCTACGYAVEDCLHENIVPAGVPYEKVEKFGEESHTRTSFRSDVCGLCLDCMCPLAEGEVQSVPESLYSYRVETEAHAMENNVCTECGYMKVLCFKKY